MEVINLDNRDWQILAVLYKEKNITKAAQTLFISQPALTVRLQQIEDYFGVTIVNRNKKGISFTTEGTYLAYSATKMLAKTYKIKEQVLNLSSNTKGTLYLGASRNFTMYTMPHVLQQFKILYPSIDFNVVTTWSQDMFELIKKQRIHIGFVSFDYGGCVERYVLYEEPLCVVSRQRFQLENLPFMPRIDYMTDLLTKIHIDKWWGEHFNKAPWITMRVNQLSTCVEMIKADLGYGIVPYRTVQNIDNLYVYNLHDKYGHTILHKTYLIYQSEVVSLRIAKIFIDFIKHFPF